MKKKKKKFKTSKCALIKPSTKAVLSHHHHLCKIFGWFIAGHSCIMHGYSIVSFLGDNESLAAAAINRLTKTCLLGGVNEAGTHRRPVVCTSASIVTWKHPPEVGGENKIHRTRFFRWIFRASFEVILEGKLAFLVKKNIFPDFTLYLCTI